MNRIAITVFGTLSIAAVAHPQTVVSDLAYFSSGRTLAQACIDASGKVLAVSQRWLLLTTQSLRCNIQVYPGAIIQPAPGQIVTIAGSFSSPDTRTLDTSLGRPGSIVFTGPTVSHAEWFGAAATSTPALNTLAIQSALYAFPAVPGALAQGRFLIHEGAAQIGCGVFLISGTIFMNVGMRWDFPCARSTTIKLASGSFKTTAEEFMIQVLPTLIGGIPTPNVTQSVVLSGGAIIDCNGAENPGCSNLKFYGAENSSVKEFAFTNAALRGVALGDTCARDAFCKNTSDSVVFENNWIIGLGVKSVGPGLYIRCTGCSFPDTKVQYFNSAARFTGAAATGEPNPEIWIDGSNTVSTHDSYGECDARFMEITNSVNLNLINLFPGSRGPTCPAVVRPLAIRISGNSSNNIIGPGSETYFGNVLQDISTEFGAGPYPMIPGGAGTFPWRQYISDAPWMGHGINLLPNDNSAIGLTQVGTAGLSGAMSVTRPAGSPIGSDCWIFYLGSSAGDANPTASITSSDLTSGACRSPGTNRYSHFSLFRGGTGAYTGYQTVLGDLNVAGGVATGPLTNLLTQGPLSISGGFGWSITTTTTAYTVRNTDGTVFCDTSKGPLTLTLPIPKIAGEIHYIKLIGSSNTLTFVAAGGHAVEVASTSTQNAVYQFQYDGVNTWRVIGKY